MCLGGLQAIVCPGLNWSALCILHKRGGSRVILSVRGYVWQETRGASPNGEVRCHFVFFCVKDTHGVFRVIDAVLVARVAHNVFLCLLRPNRCHFRIVAVLSACGRRVVNRRRVVNGAATFVFISAVQCFSCMCLMMFTDVGMVEGVPMFSHRATKKCPLGVKTSENIQPCQNQ